VITDTDLNRLGELGKSPIYKLTRRIGRSPQADFTGVMSHNAVSVQMPELLTMRAKWRESLQQAFESQLELDEPPPCFEW